MRSRADLHHYQERAARFVLERQRCALWLDLGLGKTVSTLTAVADLLDSFMVRKVLVIAPLRVANTVWAQEARQWAHLQHLRFSICTGAEKARTAALETSADVYVINRENIPWLIKEMGKHWDFDMVVVDEASSFKSASSQRFKALSRVAPSVPFFVLLTGTPAPNGLLDIWSQFHLLDRGAALGRTISAYKQKWFDSDFMGYSFSLRKGAAEEIHQAVQPMVLSMEAKDYLELPDRVDSVIRVTLPPAQMQAYRTLEREFMVQLEAAEVEAFNSGALANKCLQYCNGAVIVDEVGRWEEVHTAKLDALADLVEDNAEPMLVAYNYKADLARLRARFPRAEVLGKDPKTIERWNAGKIQMLLAHPASAGHGLNLQHGGSLIVWFGLNWSLELDQQFNARLHRQGQTKPVRVIRLVAEGCIDEKVCMAIEAKAKTQAELIAAIKVKT